MLKRYSVFVLEPVKLFQDVASLSGLHGWLIAVICPIVVCALCDWQQI